MADELDQSREEALVHQDVAQWLRVANAALDEVGVGPHWEPTSAPGGVWTQGETLAHYRSALLAEQAAPTRPTKTFPIGTVACWPCWAKARNHACNGVDVESAMRASACGQTP